mmetsp:Transcript_25787/g.80333  ORF Transcript_25787/g.80333 Transcript_25787/m.80333 type:complete len:356 (-) Transcript_25787:101-1168(-)
MVRTRGGHTTSADHEENASDGDEEDLAAPPPRPARRAAFGAVDQNRKKRGRQPQKDVAPPPPPKRPRGGAAPYAVDVEAADDPQECTEYVVDLYKYYRAAEDNWPVELYMEFQQDINPKMRAVLVDWLVEVHLKFKMLQPTIYLAVQIIDRYLSAKQIHRKKLQLLGVAALFVACKYEEIYPPEVADFTYITDHAYVAEEVLDMEMKILLELDWKITAPNPHLWIVRLCRVARAPDGAKHRAEYYAQRMLQEYHMLDYKPSLIAAAAAHLAFVAERSPALDPWPRECEKLTGYTRNELYACCKAVSFHLNAPPDSKRRLVACRKKFSRPEFDEIATKGKCPVLKRPAGLDFPAAA